jgi:hypothetical protein
MQIYVADLSYLFDVNVATSWPAFWPEQLCCKTFPGPRSSKVSNYLTYGGFLSTSSKLYVQVYLPILKFMLVSCVCASAVSLFM